MLPQYARDLSLKLLIVHMTHFVVVHPLSCVWFSQVIFISLFLYEFFFYFENLVIWRLDKMLRFLFCFHYKNTDPHYRKNRWGKHVQSKKWKSCKILLPEIVFYGHIANIFKENFPHNYYITSFFNVSKAFSLNVVCVSLTIWLIFIEYILFQIY